MWDTRNTRDTKGYAPKARLIPSYATPSGAFPHDKRVFAQFFALAADGQQPLELVLHPIPQSGTGFQPGGIKVPGSC
jgi:hypothetical protein